MEFSKYLFLVFALILVFIPDGFAFVKSNPQEECIILLHGLARSASSMETLEEKLIKLGYKVNNVDYPSRKFRIEELALTYIPQALDTCRQQGVKRNHFVTHSMGGILIRYFLSEVSIYDLGRVVMLSPPNQGSEVVDKLKNTPGFFALNGPAGMQLGTDENSLPLKLGRVNFELGVITGNSSINLILSQLIPGEDDGKVSVERAKVEGMKDFLVVEHSHPLIMTFDDVIKQVTHFLETGSFEKTTD